MRRWAFLATPRWVGYISLAVVFAIACSFLGGWQFQRRAEAREAIAIIEANYDRPAAPLGEVLPALDGYRPDQKWTPVALQGQYLSEAEMLVRNRPLNGQPGYEVLTPFLVDSGEIFIVDRGWLPIGTDQGVPDEVPVAPSGRVEVIARLKAGEPVLPNRTAPAGTNQIPTINLPQIAARLDNPTYTGAYGLIVSQTPAPETTPVITKKPTLDEGPHLSYALQWYVFALIGFIGLGWAIREEYRRIHASDPEEMRRANERDVRLRARAPSDADEEDELLDAANTGS